MAQGFLIPMPQVLWDSVLQEPAQGWKLYYTHAGLGTPVTTYSDATLLSANTDPVVTSGGTWRAWVAEAVIVDIAVQNAAGVQQFTVLSVEAMPDTSGNSPSVTAVPTGGVLMWTTGTAPTGFLLCNGAAVSRATYSALNTLLSAASYPFGSGDGSTTFNVPDFRGKFPLGVATAGTGNALGATGGTIDHTHTGPAHTHTTVVPRAGWGDLAVVENTATGTLKVCGTGGGGADIPTGDQTITSSSSGTGVTSTANPPFVALNFIIKT